MSKTQSDYIVCKSAELRPSFSENFTFFKKIAMSKEVVCCNSGFHALRYLYANIDIKVSIRVHFLDQSTVTRQINEVKLV